LVDWFLQSPIPDAATDNGTARAVDEQVRVPLGPPEEFVIGRGVAVLERDDRQTWPRIQRIEDDSIEMFVPEAEANRHEQCVLACTFEERVVVRREDLDREATVGLANPTGESMLRELVRDSGLLR